jgi:translation elongation factor EF-1beta
LTIGICGLEDEKVSLDELQEKIQEDEDHVQSTDVAAMQSEYILMQQRGSVIDDDL